MTRYVGALLLGTLLASTLGGCIVRDRRRCPDGWEPEHRNERGRWVGGHCRR